MRTGMTLRMTTTTNTRTPDAASGDGDALPALSAHQPRRPVPSP